MSAPIVTANWEAKSDQTWTVPVGGGFGKIFRIGPQPVNMSLQAYYNVERPEFGPDWSLRLGVQFLFRNDHLAEQRGRHAMSRPYHDRRSVCAALAATAGLALIPGWRAQAAAPDRRTTVADAFIYAFPMLMNYKTLFQRAVDPAFPGYVGGFNRFRHYARGFTPADRDIVTPNNDTPYSWAWFDLRAEPVVISVPASPERYYVVQLVDLYTHNFAYIGSRATGTEAGDYLLAGPGWQGAAPPGVKQVLRSETDFATTLTRTAWTGPEETRGGPCAAAAIYCHAIERVCRRQAPVPAPALTFPAWDGRARCRSSSSPT